MSHPFFNTDDAGDRKFRKFTDRELAASLLGYILRYRRSSAVAAAGILAVTAMGVAGPILLGRSVNAIISGDYGLLLALMALYAGLYALNYVADNRRSFHMQLIAQSAMNDIRNDAFVKLQRLSASYYSRRETGRIMSYITNDVDALSDFVTFQLPAVLGGVVLIVLSVAIMAFLDLGLTLASLAVLPPLALLTLAFQGRIQQSFVETRKKIAVVTAKLQEGIAGVRVTQAMVEEERVSRSFDEANQENLQANLRANRLTSLFNALVQVVETGGIALVLWYGATLIFAGRADVGTLVTFMLYVNGFFTPIIQLTTFYNSYQSAITGLDRVLQLMGAEVEVKEPEDGQSQLQDGAPGIRLEGVTFGYDPARPVLTDLSLEIPAGKVVALVGPTGAGKSSVVNLILRYYDPQKGRVVFGGADVRSMKARAYRGAVGYIPQDPVLFSASIIENVRFGRPEATEEEVKDVCRSIGADDFVASLPQGYSTQLSESATNLSMGQKQLLCFARAMLARPRVVIMDEATSGVDPVSEVRLQRALVPLLDGKTAVIIAHRLSTVRLADKLVVLEGGRVVEEGSFRELVSKKDGAFSRMYSLQYELLEEGRAHEDGP
ncbi:MAG: ABC transporter ATP-binding protein [Nitrososphaerota archaeon]|nr:ABC transporter ATP-binding protein [Nitrososphaerota archaeon]